MAEHDLTATYLEDDALDPRLEPTGNRSEVATNFLGGLLRLKPAPTVPGSPIPPESPSEHESTWHRAQLPAPRPANGSPFRLGRISPAPPRVLFRALQKWEGLVLEVGNGTIRARLRDLTDPRRDDEIADIPIEEITPADRHLLEPGAVFYWYVGYESETSIEGTRSRKSTIVMRRLPRWSRREVDEAEKEAEQLRADLGLDTQ